MEHIKVGDGPYSETLRLEQISSVECVKCGDGAGFVRREYAERKKAESAWERREVDDLLVSLGIIPPKPKQSVDQLLKDLGY